MDLLTHLFSSPVSASIFFAPLLVLLAEILSGSIAAIREGSFRLNMLSDFASHQLVGYVMILVPGLLFAIASHQGLDGVGAIVNGTLAPWYLSQVSSVSRNIARITGADSDVVNTIVEAGLGKVFGSHQPGVEGDEAGTEDSVPQVPVLTPEDQSGAGN